MSRAGGVPNAWDDDDWEAQADRSESKDRQLPQAAPQPNLSRQERMQQHAEANRKLWESADSKETFHYVEAAGGGVPLTTSFKPQVKVLSRKPIIAKKDPITGLAQLSLDDDDSRPPEVQMTPDEIRAKQKRDREEKQRRYDEARAKIFGESAPSSRGSSPGTGTVTPPRTDGRGSHRGRGRGRGASYNNSGYNYSNSNVSSEGSSQQFEPRRLANQPSGRRELFDPSSSPKPDSIRRGGREGSSSDSSMRGQAGRDEHQAIRSPRGPDGSGRGGFGFAQRGNRET